MNMFPLILPSDIVSISELTDTGNCRSVLDVSAYIINKYCISFCCALFDTSDNVCLNHQHVFNLLLFPNC